MCPDWSPPAPAAPEAAHEAKALASEANEALVLGDLDRAQSFLARAVELDGGSADLLYRHARVLEEQGLRAEAIDQLCRALVSVGPGVEELSDARARIDSLAAIDRPTISPYAVAAFERGVMMARRGQSEAARTAFESALRDEPDWAPAVYNAGVTSAELGEHERAVEHFRHYLSLAPDTPDAVNVSHAIGRWEMALTSEPVRAPNPGAAFALGLVLPGTGQFYSGRPWAGMGVLALAGGAVAAGFFVKQVKVRCVGGSEEVDSCPEGQVVGRQTRRPHLGLGLGVAAAITALGAIEASFGARRARDRPAFLTTASGNDFVILSMSVP
jgi:tetratricopeptide (TPR) repeat protein